MNKVYIVYYYYCTYSGSSHTNIRAFNDKTEAECFCIDLEKEAKEQAELNSTVRAYMRLSEKLEDALKRGPLLWEPNAETSLGELEYSGFNVEELDLI